MNSSYFFTINTSFLFSRFLIALIPVRHQFFKPSAPIWLLRHLVLFHVKVNLHLMSDTREGECVFANIIYDFILFFLSCQFCIQRNDLLNLLQIVFQLAIIALARFGQRTKNVCFSMIEAQPTLELTPDVCSILVSI